MQRKAFQMFLLILAGESIFLLPFVLPRIFRPTLLRETGLNNFELGTCFSIYGTVALFSYILGGPIADRFPPKNLMSIALILTGLGGFTYIFHPSYSTFLWLYAYWGFTTIFLFWSPMIKAVRMWGNSSNQGISFGILEGGRGTIAATLGVIGLAVFAYISEMDDDSNLSYSSFDWVVLVTSSIVMASGILIKLFIEIEHNKKFKTKLIRLSYVKVLLKDSSLWTLMLIVLCAYVGYKATDDFSLYAKEVMGFSELESASVGTWQLYIRPIASVLLGFAADKSRVSLWLIIGFATSSLGSLVFSFGLIEPGQSLLFYFSIILGATGIYGLRGLYFAAIEQANIPLTYTGTAVGLISVVGYTPDIFLGPIMGYFLDNYPGLLGHQYVFGMLFFFCLLGLLASYYFNRTTKPIH